MACAAWLAGCAFVPVANPHLDEAHAAFSEALADPQVACLDPAHLAEAADALAQADKAHATLDDPAYVDHLAYIATQRARIARLGARYAADQHFTCP